MTARRPTAPRRHDDGGLDRLLSGLPELRRQVDLLIDHAEALLGLADEIARHIYKADHAARRLSPLRGNKR